MLYDVSFREGALRYELVKNPPADLSASLRIALKSLKKLEEFKYTDKENLDKAKKLAENIQNECKKITGTNTSPIQKVFNTVFCRKDKLPPSIKYLLNETLMLAKKIQQKIPLTQAELVAQAKIDAEKDPFKLFENIKNLGIKDQKELFNIALILAKTNGRGVSQFISNFIIDPKKIDEKDLFEVAMKVFQSNREAFFGYFENFGFKNRETILKFAHLAAEHGILSSRLKKFGVENMDLAIRIELALKDASSKNTVISGFIKNYGIQDEKVLIQIAELVMKNNVEQCSFLIQNYGITDPKALLKLAEIAVKTEPFVFCTYIRQFQIKDQETLVKFALEIASKKGFLISQNIKNFKIQDPNMRYQIALEAAKNDGSAVSEMLYNYEIDDPKAILDLAKAATQQCGLKIFNYVKDKYRINDPKILTELAVLGAAKNNIILSENIQKNGVSNEQAWIEIAKHSAKLDGAALSEYIQQYPISDETARAEIAQMAAKDNEFAVVDNISNFKIQNEELKLKIATTIIKEQTGLFNKTLEGLKITNEDHIYELMLLIIKSTPNFFVNNVQTFNIKNKDHALLYFLEAFRARPQVLELFSQYSGKFNDQWKNLEAFQKILSGKEQEKLYDLCPKDFKSVIDQILKLNPEKDPQKYKDSIGWLFYTAGKLSLIPNKPENNKIWSEIYNYRDPQMRFELSSRTIAIIQDPQKKAAYDAYILSDKKEILEHLRFPGLFLPTEPAYKTLKPLIQKARYLREGPMAKTFLDALNVLIPNKNLKPEEVVSILTKAFYDKETKKMRDKKDVRNNLMTIQGVVTSEMDRELINDMPFTDLLASTLIKLIPDLNTIPNFSQSIFEVFGKNPLSIPALATYASRLNTLDPTTRQQAFTLLTVFIESVLKGTFKQERYDPKFSSHLKALFEKFPDLAEKWSENKEEKLEHPNLDLKLTNTDDPVDIFLCGTLIPGSCQNVGGNPRFNKALLSYLLDGKMRLFAVKDKNNVIARTMVRLLWDEDSQKPVLFQEPAYHQHQIDEKILTALDQYVLKQAKELGLDVYKSAFLEKYQTNLVSKGGRAPWEYVDALQSFQENSVYKVQRAKKVE